MSSPDPHRRYDYDNQPTRQSPAYDRDRRSYPDPNDPYEPEDPEYLRQRHMIIFQKIANIVWLITFFILAVILLRFVMLLINANEQNSFVSWVYDTSAFFVRPFLGITNDPTFNGSVLEINSLIAMLIYMLLIYGILQLVKVVLDLLTPSEP